MDVACEVEAGGWMICKFEVISVYCLWQMYERNVVLLEIS